MSPDSETLSARLDVLTVIVQELAGALSPAQARQVADGVRRRVSDLAGNVLSEPADAAVAADLSALLQAAGAAVHGAQRTGTAAAGASWAFHGPA